jgi:hypothetical protein
MWFQYKYGMDIWPTFTIRSVRHACWPHLNFRSWSATARRRLAPYLFHGQTLACRIQLGICHELCHSSFWQRLGSRMFATSWARSAHQVSRDTIEALEKKGASAYELNKTSIPNKSHETTLPCCAGNRPPSFFLELNGGQEGHLTNALQHLKRGRGYKPSLYPLSRCW